MESVLEAGRLYRSIGDLDEERLRPHVLRAWVRSHEGGADPRRPHADALSSIDTERLRERHRGLLHAAEPYLCALHRASGDERHAVILGDAKATVLDVRGDEQTVHGPERVPGPGALLAESACGANGVGTALAEDGYTELVGPEHFIQGFQDFTCQGIPLRDGEGAVSGVLSVSVRRPEVGRRLYEILLCAAHAIEMDLVAGRLELDMERVLAAGDVPVEQLQRLLQDVFQVQAAARLRLEIAADQLATNLLTQTRDLLQLAATVLRRFRRRAALWRALALDEPLASRPVVLDALVRDIAELLEVESAVCGVTTTFEEVERVVVEAAPHTLARALFRVLLGAIQAARGGAVHIALRSMPAGGELCLVLAPGPGVVMSAPPPVRILVPARLEASKREARDPGQRRAGGRGQRFQ
ncbi:sigma-54-dependent Fis family transcriptional regulator [Sorangium sp. So ce1078]|uniref:sigma-54-dependent Fis family transcriptional regulator n=1 Tax=Sorangium sp. So ce1078 TaxID=3133329 RepID=UPI003F631B54